MIITVLVLILFAILFPGFMRAAFAGLFAIIVLAVVLTSAHSSDGPPLGFPEFDVERNCGMLFKGNNGFFNQCISEEEVGYRALYFVWPEVPDEVRGFCVDHFERLTGGDRPLSGGIYSGIINCVVGQKAKYDAEHQTQPRRKFSP